MGRCLKGKGPRIAITVLAFLVTLLASVSVFLPRNIGNTLQVTGSPIQTLGISKETSKVNCDIDESGKYVITDSDPQMIFSCEGQDIQSIKINLAAPTDKVVDVEVYTAFADAVFTAERCYASCVLSGTDGVTIAVPKEDYKYIRVDVNSDQIYLKDIELYDVESEGVPFVPDYSTKDYVKAAIVPVFVALIVWLIERYTKVTEKTVAAIKENKAKVGEATLASVVAVLISVVIEFLISIIDKDGAFSIYRMIFIAGVLGLAVIFVYGRKSLSKKPENVFLPVVLVLGIVMLFGSPAKHIAWDFDSHYPWAVDMSYMDVAYYTNMDTRIDKVSGETLVLESTALDNYDEYIENANKFDETVASQKFVKFSLPHLPSGVFIAVARFLGANFIVKYNLGRLANLLVYALVCYFAIKRIKSGKMLLSVICLFPTCLFLATNYGYDHWVNSFSILGLAYYVSELQEPDKPVSVMDTIIMCGAFALSALPKLIYVVLMAMPLFMYKNWSSKKEKRRYYMILIIIFAIVFAGFVIRSMGSITGSGDSRGGAVNPSEQLAGILSNPFGYIKLLFNFLTTYLSLGTTKEYISHFSYLGIGEYWIIIVILMGVVALTDTNSSIKFKIPMLVRILSIVLFVGMAALIASAMYISFTPVGAETVLGCQPRYMLPIVAPLWLLVTGQRWDVADNKAVYNGVVLGSMSSLVMIEIYSQIIIRMI